MTKRKLILASGIAIIIGILLVSNILMYMELRRAELIGSFSVFKAHQESLRLTSPDGKVDAVVMFSPAPATAEDLTDVFIVPKAQAIAWTMGSHHYRVFQGYYIDALDVEWATDRVLTIEYGQGVICTFKNCIDLSYDLGEERPYAYTYEVKEICQNASALPCDFWDYYRWTASREGPSSAARGLPSPIPERKTSPDHDDTE
jgi:hypothetical protein